MKISYVDRFGRWHLQQDAKEVELEVGAVTIQWKDGMLVIKEGEENG